jgi:excisionase family DNA binding protein
MKCVQSVILWKNRSKGVEGRFLKPEDIARELDIKVETVQGWCRTKKLPAYKIGGEYRIERSDYEEFLRQRRTTEKK